MIDYLIKYSIAAVPSNLDGSSKTVSVISNPSTYEVSPREVVTGDLVLAFSSFDQAKLYVVTESGPWNEVDNQPVDGDTLMAVAEDAPLLQQGTLITCVRQEHFVSTPGTGFVLQAAGLPLPGQ